MSESVVVLRSILTISFLTFGGMKLLGVGFVKKLFADFKLNRTAMILFGLLEILFVVGLYAQNLAFYSSLGLAYITSAALYKHFKASHPFIKFVPAFILLVLSMITAILLLKPV